MKLLLDEKLADSTCALCRKLGYDTKSVKSERWQGKDDDELMLLAQEEKRVVITLDKDFGNLLKYPLADHFGVVLIDLRDQRPVRVNKRLEEILPNLANRDLAKSLIVIGDGSVRIRKV